MFHLALLGNRALGRSNLAGFMASVGRGGLKYVLLVLVALRFVLLLTIPVNSPHPAVRAAHRAGRGGLRAVQLAERRGHHVQRPGQPARGGLGHARDAVNPGSAVNSRGFSSLMIAGLATTPPGALSSELQARGTSAYLVAQVAGQPPSGCCSRRSSGSTPSASCSAPPVPCSSWA